MVNTCLGCPVGLVRLTGFVLFSAGGLRGTFKKGLYSALRPPPHHTHSSSLGLRAERAILKVRKYGHLKWHCSMAVPHVHVKGGERDAAQIFLQLQVETKFRVCSC